MAKDTYTEAVGRRKEASARVRLTSAKSSSMVVNGKDATAYFPLEAMVKTAFAPLQALGMTFADFVWKIVESCMRRNKK